MLKKSSAIERRNMIPKKTGTCAECVQPFPAEALERVFLAGRELRFLPSMLMVCPFAGFSGEVNRFRWRGKLSF